MNKNTKKLTMSALFAALTCVATFISIPSINGYIHIGDALVIITGILLGPVHGGLAAGIGSALTDLIKGYAVYVPATFIIKGLIAIVCYFIYHKATSKIKNIYIKTIIAGIFGACIMVVGYFGYEFVLYGKGAIAGIFGNMIQGISGIVLSAIFLPQILKITSTNDL